MQDKSRNPSGASGVAASQLPPIVDRGTWQAELDELRIREKEHTRAGDAIAAARRKLPIVEVNPRTALIGMQGPTTLLDTFEGRRQLVAYYFMWYKGKPETFWTNGRGVEAMDYSYALMDLSVYGRQEAWEDSPAGWPQRDHYNYRTDGRPIAQWGPLQAGRSDSDQCEHPRSGRTR